MSASIVVPVWVIIGTSSIKAAVLVILVVKSVLDLLITNVLSVILVLIC